MYYLGRAIVWIAFHIAFRIRTEGKENIPEGAVIYASNHRTNADPPLVAITSKGELCFMAKEELFHNKFFGALIRSLGAFPVSRGSGDMEVIDKAVNNLKDGKNLMIFPEGTRSKDGKVQKGHSGAALIAARTGKLIVPVGICFGEKLKFRTKITVKFGKPVDPAEYVEISDTPKTRNLVKIKKRYMQEIKLLVEGQPDEKIINQEEENA